MGIVEKSKVDGKIKLTHTVPDLSDIIKKTALSAALALKADFVGIDLVLTKDDKVYVIESNVSPQFLRYSQLTKTNPATAIFQMAVS